MNLPEQPGVTVRKIGGVIVALPEMRFRLVDREIEDFERASRRLAAMLRRRMRTDARLTEEEGWTITEAMGRVGFTVANLAMMTGVATTIVVEPKDKG